MSNELSEFPVDDATLLAVEHALGYYLTSDEEADARGDEFPFKGAGADYSLHNLLDFMAGCYDPPELDSEDNPALIREGDLHGIPLYVDTRTHYTPNDIIEALIHEVRRLREKYEDG